MRCQTAESLLSEYIDNRLSARETWELDKHLAECNRCTRVLNETRRTVSLLSEAPSFSVSDDFTANLQARIARIEPAPARKAWLHDLREALRPRARPLWAAGLAVCALAIVVVVQNHPASEMVESPGIAAPAGADTRFVQTARTHSIALAASDPFGDTAAANVAATVASPASAADSQSGPVY